MIPGETILSGGPSECPDCHTKLELQVLMSPAGYYIGTWCMCGPYSRGSDYYATREEAQRDLDDNSWLKKTKRKSEYSGEIMRLYRIGCK